MQRDASVISLEFFLSRVTEFVKNSRGVSLETCLFDRYCCSMPSQRLSLFTNKFTIAKYTRCVPRGLVQEYVTKKFYECQSVSEHN